MADKDQPVDKNTDKSSDNKEYDPRLDFYSDKFDPLLALKSPSISIPVPKAKVFDNVSLYYSSKQHKPQQKQNKPDSKQVVPGSSSSSNTITTASGRRFLPHQMPIPTQRKPFVGKNIYTQLESISGPLALLRKCIDEKIQVKIWTRNHKEIRGYCTGHVVIFDKHWNVVLENVTEVWNRPKSQKVPALDSHKANRSRKISLNVPEVKIISSTKSTETCTRFIDQFLLRGEHIAVIALLK